MSNESIEMTEQDAADLQHLYEDGAIPLDGTAPEYHTIMHVWREVLAPAQNEAGKPVTPQWASRICSSYQQINFADMNTFRDLYFGLLEELKEILLFEISTDSECLNYTTPEEDVEHNTHHYLNLLRDWQLAILSREMAWDCTSPTAAVELGVLSEVHKMFFSQQGLTAFLDNIKFEYTDADRDELAAVINELREGK